MNILALNAGSSSLKYKLFQMPNADGGNESVLAEGNASHGGGSGIIEAAEQTIEECAALGVDVVAHRLVHGGPHFWRPTRVTPEVIGDLKSIRDLDPLHNPNEVAMIEAAVRLLPDAVSVAVFDTGFHQTLPEHAWRYAIDTELADKYKIRRYGFHGLSHQFVSTTLLRCMGRRAAGTRLIVCHLGNGASICAVKDGASVDTSMGMTPLEGLVMGTRSGDIDPGVLLYLMRSAKMSANDIDEALNHNGGLAGLAGSADVRDLEAAEKTGDIRAGLALEIFCYRVRKYIGAYSAAMGGLDAVAFTGGIGEHSSGIRSKVCRELGFVGILVDETRNVAAKDVPSRITMDVSRVQVWMIPTNEELQMAREARSLFDD